MLQGDRDLIDIFTQHGNYAWKGQNNRSVMGTLCGQIEKNDYETLQYGLIKRVRKDCTKTGTTSLLQEFLDYGDFRGIEPVKLAEVYGDKALKSELEKTATGRCSSQSRNPAQPPGTRWIHAIDA